VEPASATLGIDLSAQSAGTGACLLNWGEDGVTALALADNLDDGALTELRARAETTAVDAPFGWPEAYVRALYDWHSGGSWPAVPRQQLRFRATDLQVQRLTGIWPLSPSSDRIAVCAWRCAELLSGWDVRDRLGGDGVVEAYPAAALKCWGLPWRGYKAQAPAARERTGVVRAQIVVELRRSCPWLQLTDQQWRYCEQSHDVLDALVCALVARAASSDATMRPDESVVERAAAEGWIQLPTVEPLSALWTLASRVT
jgi:predicted nuclease with RNAse H fold